MPPTVKDVARAAGVSTATVSRVLNRVGYVEPETAKAVTEAVRKLGYRRNIKLAAPLPQVLRYHLLPLRRP